jgi:hypothetical protein
VPAKKRVPVWRSRRSQLWGYALACCRRRNFQQPPTTRPRDPMFAASPPRFNLFPSDPPRASLERFPQPVPGGVCWCEGDFDFATVIRTQRPKNAANAVGPEIRVVESPCKEAIPVRAPFRRSGRRGGNMQSWQERAEYEYWCRPRILVSKQERYRMFHGGGADRTIPIFDVRREVISIPELIHAASSYSRSAAC